MAGIQRKSNQIDVVFFERNGLRHGEFTLRSPSGPVEAHERIRLEWNSDSTVLAVIFKDMLDMFVMASREGFALCCYFNKYRRCDRAHLPYIKGIVPSAARQWCRCGN
ncbi:hypothetical protein LB505_005028 [Fusarium chuoi]|nr:hypothetical protein LB505_005028 [Fusarium chuoi]